MLHIEISLVGDYAANEAFAYAFGNTVGWMVGYDMGEINSIHYQLLTLNPFVEIGSSDDLMGYANQVLAAAGYNKGKEYSRLWPIQGRDYFLGIVEVYWFWGPPSSWSWVY